MMSTPLRLESATCNPWATTRHRVIRRPSRAKGSAQALLLGDTRGPIENNSEDNSSLSGKDSPAGSTSQPPPQPPALPAECAPWQCSCQQLADMTGADDTRRLWGNASKAQRDWWLRHHCKTVPRYMPITELIDACKKMVMRHKHAEDWTWSDLTRVQMQTKGTHGKTWYLDYMGGPRHFGIGTVLN